MKPRGGLLEAGADYMRCPETYRTRDGRTIRCYKDAGHRNSRVGRSCTRHHGQHPTTLEALVWQ